MPQYSSAPAVRALSALLLTGTLAACNTDSVTQPLPPAAGTFSVDAATEWVYVSLADSAIVRPSSPGESPSWDIAFFATNATLNGGEAGPGGVEAACVCQNATATGDEVLAMTPESELADFEAVTSVPAGLTWTSDALSPAITGWYSGSGTAAVANPSRTFLVRLADSTAFAKVRVVNLEQPTTTTPGRVTLEYAVQDSPSAALRPVQIRVVEVAATGATLVDLNAGSSVPLASGWDLKFEGFAIKVNGGMSGPGKGGAALATTSWAETTSAKTADRAYRTDSYAGIFGSNRYYRYSIAGDNRISPTFDVYLLRRGSTVYKLQIIGYYSQSGQPRTISFRYAQIAG